MFGRNRMAKLEGRIKRLEATKACEKCHGIFAKWVVGEPEIRMKKLIDWRLADLGMPLELATEKEEYIHKPIYCERCAPKPKRAAKRTTP